MAEMQKNNVKVHILKYFKEDSNKQMNEIKMSIQDPNVEVTNLEEKFSNELGAVKNVNVGNKKNQCIKLKNTVESTTNRLDQDITKTGIEDKFKA
jgi:hypothetical protein